MLWGLWQNGTESVHDVRVMNTDVKPYWEKSPEKLLEEVEKRKNNINLDRCLQQCIHFSSFIASIDGLLGVEATATL